MSKAACTFAMVCILGGAASASAHPGTHARLRQATDAIKKAPRVAENYVSRAEVRCEHLDFAGAEHDFAAARRIAPGDVGLHLRETQAWYDAGKKRTAATSLVRLLKLDNARSDVLLLAALVHHANGRMADAVDAARRAVGVAQRPDALLFAHRARIEIDAGEAYREQAVAGLYEGMVQVGANVVLVELAMEAELARKRPDAALALIEFLPPQLARTPKWKLRRAEFLAINGQTDAACAAFRETLQSIASAPAARQQHSVLRDIRDAAARGAISLGCAEGTL